MAENSRTRRSILVSAGTISAVGLAGCLGDDDDETTVEGDSGESTDDSDESHGHDEEHDDDGHGHDDDGHGHDDEEEGHGHEGPEYDLDIIDRSSDEIVAYVHGDHWHGGLPDVEVGEYLSLGAVFTDSDGEEVALGTDEDFELNATVAEGAEEGIISVDRHGDHIHITGEAAGRTQVVFQLYHDDHSDFDAPSLDIQVVEA